MTKSSVLEKEFVIVKKERNFLAIGGFSIITLLFLYCSFWVFFKWIKLEHSVLLQPNLFIWFGIVFPFFVAMLFGYGLYECLTDECYFIEREFVVKAKELKK